MPTLSFICSAVEADTKKPFARDPRVILRRAEDQLARSGIADASRWGPEFEFYIFDQVSLENNIHVASYRVNSCEANWNASEPGGGHAIPIHGGYHAIPPRDRTYELRAEMVMFVPEACNVPVEYHHHEVGGPGQCEIETPMMGVMQSADAAMIIKYVTKMVAYRAGKSVTFLPKPLFGEAGSGMHFHQLLSLLRGNENLFYDQNDPGLLERPGTILYWRSFDARTSGPGFHQSNNEFLQATGARIRSTSECFLLLGEPQCCHPRAEICNRTRPGPFRISSARRDLQSIHRHGSHAPGWA